MKKQFFCIVSLFVLLFAFTGCSSIGDKTASVSIIYVITAVLSLIIFVGYCCLVKKKDVRFILLYASVLVVNAGYYTLSVSQTLGQALLANRIAYLGSVFLPLSMLLIILKIIKIQYKKWLPIVLSAIAIVVFLIAASPGYLDIYYKEVSIETINGVTVLNKVYGELHIVFLMYLLCYFAAMVGSIVYAVAKRRIDSPIHAVLFAIAVFANLGVWLIEQLVKLDFEMLSISYIISELFLLGICMAIGEENDVHKNAPACPLSVEKKMANTCESSDAEQKERLDVFTAGIAKLTNAERAIFDLYTDGKSTKEVLTTLNIKENTLKFHNKNIYSKLGVSSRKQLLELYKITTH